MSRRRKVALALLSAMALVAAGEIANAQPNERASGDTAAPPYTLEVDSDAPDVISFEVLAARIGSDLGGAVARPGAAAASRAAISIRYRDRELTVRAVHPGGRLLERSVKAEGDDAAVQREAVLLAGNLARDEAREILDALAARPPAVLVPEAKPEPKPAPKPAVDEGTQRISVAFVFPLATNSARPNVASNLNFSVFYGRVGTVRGVQLGGGFVYATRRVDGVQLGVAAAATAGPVEGVQLAGGGSLATGSLEGAQVGGAGNLVKGPMRGTQLGGVANVALAGVSGVQLGGAFNGSRGSMSGVQISGGGNVVTRNLIGAQLGAVNVAESVEGAQLGVVNVGRKVRGVQLGAINIGDDVEGASIGVISISRDGIHPIAWTSNLQYMNAGVKFATKYTYTIAAVHYGTLEGDFGNVGTTAALGGHIPVRGGFDLELQGALTHLVPRPSQSTKTGNVWLAPQVVAGYSFASHLRLFAGAGARLPLSVDLGRDVVRPEVLAGVQF